MEKLEKNPVIFVSIMILAVVLSAVGYYYAESPRSNKTTDLNTNQVINIDTNNTEVGWEKTYVNKEFGFQITLPDEMKGYWVKIDRNYAPYGPSTGGTGNNVDFYFPEKGWSDGMLVLEIKMWSPKNVYYDGIKREQSMPTFDGPSAYGSYIMESKNIVFANRPDISIPGGASGCVDCESGICVSCGTGQPIWDIKKAFKLIN